MPKPVQASSDCRGRPLPWSIISPLMQRITGRGRHLPPVEGFDEFVHQSRQPTGADLEAATRFLQSDASDLERYELLFRYFAAGAWRHADEHGSRLYYRGYAHRLGRRISGLEGFARTAPLLAAWLHSGRDRVVTLADRSKIDLSDFLRRAFLAGTDENGPGFWGTITDGDQRIIEAADIARAIWLSRATIWNELSAREQEQVGQWLAKATGVRVSSRNNWLLCPVVTGAILEALGVPARFRTDYYEEFKHGCARESGWFSDGPTGPIDFYNSWGISYELFWLRLVRPRFDSQFIDYSLSQAAELTARLISPDGVPILGRSLCYRTAISCPLIAAALLPVVGFDPGEARRGMDLVWRYFIRHRALRDGGLTLGYLDNDPRLVDAYSGAGSCHWGLRSLTLAMAASPSDRFWTAPPRPLPIERETYHIELPTLGWSVTGDRATRDITIQVHGNSGSAPVLDPMSMRRRMKQLLLGRPSRPANSHVKYDLAHYSARSPLGGTVTPPTPLL